MALKKGREPNRIVPADSLLIVEADDPDLSCES
jgi:hypothetical protein